MSTVMPVAMVPVLDASTTDSAINRFRCHSLAAVLQFNQPRAPIRNETQDQTEVVQVEMVSFNKQSPCPMVTEQQVCSDLFGCVWSHA